jgi:mRNA interferase MazF
MINKWGIYRANLDPVIGSEQGKTRPVLIISENEINQVINTVNVIPITSRKLGRNLYPNEALLPKNVFGLPNESILLCHQIRTLDKKRISLEYGSVMDSKLQDEINNALCFQLGIE